MTRESKLAEIVELGVKMRAAQKAYFKTRTPEALAASKTFERAFDKAAADLHKPPGFL